MHMCNQAAALMLWIVGGDFWVEDVNMVSCIKQLGKLRKEMDIWWSLNALHSQ